MAVRVITYLKNLDGGENKPGGFYLYHDVDLQGYDYTIYVKKIRDPENAESAFPNVDHMRIAFKCVSGAEVLFDDAVENLEVGNLEPANLE